MKITAIKRQVKRPDRYSFYVDGSYAFSLGEAALLESKIAKGQELSEQQLGRYKQLAKQDIIYNKVLRYAAYRLRSEWEIQTYLQRNKISPPLSDTILNKLRDIDFINDEKFARAFVNDRRLLRSTSRRKLTLELRQKHIAGDLIEQALADQGDYEAASLQAVIKRKRQQTRYRDNLKLMQYLSRQGFNYQDIKSALEESQAD